MGKKEIKSSIIELKDEQTKLQIEIDEWNKDKPDINHPNSGLWITQLGKYTDRMTGLENTLNNLYELLKQPQYISNGMFSPLLLILLFIIVAINITESSIDSNKKIVDYWEALNNNTFIDNRNILSINNSLIKSGNFV